MKPYVQDDYYVPIFQEWDKVIEEVKHNPEAPEDVFEYMKHVFSSFQSLFGDDARKYLEPQFFLNNYDFLIVMVPFDKLIRTHERVVNDPEQHKFKIYKVLERYWGVKTRQFVQALWEHEGLHQH